MNEWNRRDFLKIGGTAAATLLHVERPHAVAERTLAAPPIATVRIGMVGVGLQGGSHLRNFLGIPGCRITAVCDVREERTSWAQQQVVAAGHPSPTAYSRGPRDFERLCEVEDLDLGRVGSVHEPRDSLAPQDPLEEVVTFLLRIKGGDLAAYRAGRIDREEAMKRVQIREF